MEHVWVGGCAIASDAAGCWPPASHLALALTLACFVVWWGGLFVQWDLTNVTGQVIDVYNAPALQKGGVNDPLATPSQYLVFEVDAAADNGAGRLRAFQRIGSSWGGISHEKSLKRAQLPLVGATAEPCAVGATRVRASSAQAVPSDLVV